MEENCESNNISNDSDEDQFDFEVMTSVKDKESNINSFDINYQENQMGVATTQGFRVYKLPEFSLLEIQEKPIFPFSVKLLSLYGQSQLIALVPDKIIDHELYSEFKAYIYDFKYKKFLKSVDVLSNIIFIKLMRKCLITLSNNVFNPNDTESNLTSEEKIIKVYNLESENNDIIRYINCSNYIQYFSYSINNEKLFLTYMNKQKKIFIENVEDIHKNSNNAFFVEITNQAKCQFIQLSNQGNLLALANDKGTEIDIIKLFSQEKLCTLWRGKKQANIILIKFSADDKMVFIMSDRKTIHMYELNEVSSQQQVVSKFKFSTTLIITKFALSLQANQEEDDKVLVAIDGEGKKELFPLDNQRFSSQEKWFFEYQQYKKAASYFNYLLQEQIKNIFIDTMS